MKKALDKINDLAYEFLSKGLIISVEINWSNTFITYLFRIDDPITNISLIEEIRRICTMLKWENYVKSYNLMVIGKNISIHLKK